MKREEAIAILDEYVETQSLHKHLRGVEAAMRAYARSLGEDEEQWGNAGLLHDFDWDICPTPEEHPMFGARLLRERGVPEELVRAVLSHGDHIDAPRETLMEKYVYAVDELSGFITAVGPGAAEQEPVGGGRAGGAEEDEGQVLRPGACDGTTWCGARRTWGWTWTATSRTWWRR